MSSYKKNPKVAGENAEKWNFYAANFAGFGPHAPPLVGHCHFTKKLNDLQMGDVVYGQYGL